MKEELIDLIFTATPIWDKRDNNHHNRYVLAKEWGKIATKLGVDVSEAKTIWKNLRQEFGKQFKKHEGKSGDQAPEEIASSWPFFQKLQFLKDQFTPRSSSGNLDMENNPNPQIPPNEDSASILGENPDENDSEPPEDQINESPGCATPMSTGSQHSASTSDSFTRTGYRKRLTVQAQIGKALLALEKEKVEMAKQKKSVDPNDDDVAFFNSLVPTVKILPLQKKLAFRMRVQQLLYDFAFPEPSWPNQSGPNPSSAYEHIASHQAHNFPPSTIPVLQHARGHTDFASGPSEIRDIMMTAPSFTLYYNEL